MLMQKPNVHNPCSSDRLRVVQMIIATGKSVGSSKLLVSTAQVNSDSDNANVTRLICILVTSSRTNNNASMFYVCFIMGIIYTHTRTLARTHAHTQTHTHTHTAHTHARTHTNIYIYIYIYIYQRAVS